MYDYLWYFTNLGEDLPLFGSKKLEWEEFRLLETGARNSQEEGAWADEQERDNGGGEISADSFIDNLGDTWGDYMRAWDKAQNEEGKAAKEKYDERQAEIEKVLLGTKVSVVAWNGEEKKRVLRKDDSGYYVKAKGERIELYLIGRTIVRKDEIKL